MKKNVLIINAHPNPESLCASLSKAYYEGAVQTNAVCKLINLSDLNFEPNLRFGYQKRTELEPDLVMAWNSIREADHIVWVYPNWWGTYPALLKSFIDRLFLPGMAFRTYPNTFKMDKLLSGKTAHIMVTMDSPSIYYRLYLHQPGHNSMKKSVLAFCGIKTTSTTNIRGIKEASVKKIDYWLKQAKQQGLKLK